jgi:hypothetical protein
VRAQPFAKRWTENTDNTDLLDKQLVDSEQNYFANNLSVKQQNYLKAERLAMLSMQKKHLSSDKHWWNKLNKMSDAEFKMMPFGFIKKYGAILNALQNQRDEFNTDNNKTF